MTKQQVHAFVAEEVKEEWVEYVESSDTVTSMSHLIRLSVSKEINSEFEPQSQEVDVDLAPIEQRLTTIEEELSLLSNRLDGIQGLEDSSLTRLASDLYELLPRIHPEVLERKIREGRVVSGPNDFEIDTEDGPDHPLQPWEFVPTIEYIAIEIDENQYEVARAAEKLADDMARIELKEVEESMIAYERVDDSKEYTNPAIDEY